MATAVYLHDRLPSKVIDDDIPFERWFIRPPGIKGMFYWLCFFCNIQVLKLQKNMLSWITQPHILGNRISIVYGLRTYWTSLKVRTCSFWVLWTVRYWSSSLWRDSSWATTNWACIYHLWSARYTANPGSFQDAISRPDHESWWTASYDETVVIINNRTWELFNLPPGKNILSALRRLSL